MLMLEHGVYSVISPEGCAAILWDDPAKVPDAASALKMTAQDLVDLHIVDEVIPEPLGGAHRDTESHHRTSRQNPSRTKCSSSPIFPEPNLLTQRDRKYRRIGAVSGIWLRSHSIRQADRRVCYFNE